MTKVKEEVAGKEYYKEIHFLYEILNSLKGKEEIKSFFKDMLTKSELVMLKRRWHVASLLFDGMDIRTVAMLTQTSTQTVSRMKNILEEGLGGLVTALERTKKNNRKENNKSAKGQNFGGSKFVKGWFQ